MLNRIMCVASLSALTLAATADNSKALQYKLTNVRTGASTNLAKLKGRYKAIYLDFFGSWCIPCQKAIPEVIKLNNRYGAHGAAFIGLDFQDTPAGVKRDIQARGINYAVLRDESRNGTLPTLLNVAAAPTVIILDGRTLKEKGRWSGIPSAATLAQEVKVLKSLGVK